MACAICSIPSSPASVEGRCNRRNRMKTLKIDFVSDVACPWCAIGLNALERALERVAPDVDAELHFQPFELNPTMPPEGADTVQYLSDKYGITPEQIARNQANIRARGA